MVGILYVNFGTSEVQGCGVKLIFFLKTCVTNYPDNGILQAYWHTGFIGKDVSLMIYINVQVHPQSTKKQRCNVTFQSSWIVSNKCMLFSLFSAVNTINLVESSYCLICGLPNGKWAQLYVKKEIKDEYGYHIRRIGCTVTKFHLKTMKICYTASISSSLSIKQT